MDDAKKKWKNLRAYFISQMRELDKPRSGSAGGVKTTSSWAYFQQLLFLKNVVIPLDEARDDNLTSTQSSQILTNRRETQNIVQDIETEIVPNSPLLEINPDSDTDVHTFSATASEQSESVQIQPQPGSSKQTPSSKSNFRMIRANANKRKLNTGNQGRSDNTAAKVLEIETRKVELLEKEMNAEEDPNLLFFKSLLPFMKPFTPTQTLRVRGKVQDMILKEYEAMQQDFGTSSRNSNNDESVIASLENESHRSTSRSSHSIQVTSPNSEIVDEAMQEVFDGRSRNCIIDNCVTPHEYQFNQSASRLLHCSQFPSCNTSIIERNKALQQSSTSRISNTNDFNTSLKTGFTHLSRDLTHSILLDSSDPSPEEQHTYTNY